MTTNALKIDSNSVGIRFAEEDRTQVIGTLPTAASQVWYPMEPNTETNFGGNVKTIARQPIDPGRQLNKGSVVDLDVEGTMQQDLTQDGLTRIMQGYFFASIREEGDTLPINGNSSTINAVVNASHKYKIDYADTVANVVANSLIECTGFTKSANNGLNVVSSVSFVAATQVLTSTANYSNAETVTIGSTVYTMKSSLTPAAYEVKIGASEAATILNLHNAINMTGGGVPGTDYASTTVAHPNVTAVDNGSHTVTITAKRKGYAANLIATTETSATASWGAATMAGGVGDIVVVATGVLDESPTSTARIERVGHQGASADLTITNDLANYPYMTSTLLDFTTLPLIPGQWIWIGGDTAGTAIANGHTNDNGWARIKSIIATRLTFDKTGATMTTDAGTGITLQFFWGKVLKNENSPSFQVRRSYTLERTLGVPDSTLPAGIQAEYLKGAVPNEMTINFSAGAKIEVDMSFLACTKSEIAGTGTILSQAAINAGSQAVNAPTIVSGDMYNTTSHVARARMHVVSTTDAFPTSLFAELMDAKITIKNNLKALKAIRTLGAFEVNAGFFEVNGTGTLYFNDIAAMQAVRNGSDVSLDFALARNNAGILFDLPLMATSDARADVKINEPIMLPLTMQVGRDRTFNHTMLVEFFDYLPNLAMPS